MPVIAEGVADMSDQNLRGTSVTWLARARCTHPEIAQITGHSMQRDRHGDQRA